MLIKYYVYIHKTADTHEVFYVGKGCGDRAYSSHHRSDKWKTVVKNHGGFIAEILANNMSNKDALSLEEDIIYNPLDWVLINTVKPSHTRELDFSYFNKYLYYDQTSSSGLRWKVHIGKGSSKKIPGSIAGTKNSAGYWSVQLEGKCYRAHRIVWLLVNKSINADLVINHIDSNPSNNVISNLEECTALQNAQKAITATNHDGVREACNNGYYYAIARWYDNNGIRKSKSFSYKKYGKEGAWKLATEYRNNLLNKDS